MKFFFLITCLTGALVAHGQKTIQLGNSGFDELFVKHTDSRGSFYIGGQFTGSLDIDPSANTNMLTSNGGGDGIVAKYDSTQKLLWGFSIGNAGTDDRITAIGTDGFSNVLVAVRFKGKIDINPSPNDEYILENNGQYENAFLAKYDAGGNLLWGFAFTATTSTILNIKIIPDRSGGQIYISGNFIGTNDFDPRETKFNLSTIPTPRGDERTSFIAKYDETLLPLKLQWAINISGNLYAMDVVNEFVSPGVYHPQVYISGSAQTDSTALYAEFIDYDPGPGIVRPNGVGTCEENIFAGKYDGTSGSYLWTYFFYSYGDRCNERGSFIVCEPLGRNVYVAGQFAGDYSRYTGDDLTLKPFGGAGFDGLLVKFDRNGKLKWQKHFGNKSDYDDVSALTIDSRTFNITLAGTYIDTVELNENNPSKIQISKGGYDSYIVEFTRDGQYVQSGSIGGNGDDGIYNIRTGLYGLNFKTSISGLFSETCDVIPGAKVKKITSAGDLDFFHTVLPYPYTREPVLINKSNAEELTAHADIRVYPNPSASIVNIEIKQNAFTAAPKYKIYNSMGIEVKSGVLTNITNAIVVEELKAGIYEISVMADEVNWKTKLIKL